MGLGDVYKRQTVNKVVLDKNLDAKGKAKLDLSITNLKNSSGKMRVNFKARAFEKGGDFSANNFSIPFYPFESNVGVRLPRNRWGHERMTAGKENTMNFVALDNDGNPLKNRQLNIGIYRVNWPWWYERDRRKAAKFNLSLIHISEPTRPY